jgi:hypothetical protein
MCTGGDDWPSTSSTTAPIAGFIPTTEQIYGHLLAPDGRVGEAVERMLFSTEAVQMEDRRRYRR